jgi:hypothetical protein
MGGRYSRGDNVSDEGRARLGLAVVQDWEGKQAKAQLRASSETILKLLRGGGQRSTK